MPKAEILPDNIPPTCHNDLGRITELRYEQTMRPYLVTHPAGGILVADFAFRHKDGGLCFLLTGWDDDGNTHSPFHILEGPVWFADGVWHSSEGATIRGLTVRDKQWREWERWNVHKDSGDFPRNMMPSDKFAIEGCRKNGAIGEPLKGGHNMSGPWVIRFRGAYDSYGRVAECVWHHRDGGLCFLDVGRGLHSAVPPFHILEEGDRVVPLTPGMDEWSNWQVWLDFLDSPDYVEANCLINYDNLREHGGALLDQPYEGG